MSADKQVIFRLKKNGKAEYEIKGAPGGACLDIKQGIAPILEKIGVTELATENTEEMHVHAGKDPEAHNNL